MNNTLKIDTNNSVLNEIIAEIHKEKRCSFPHWGNWVNWTNWGNWGNWNNWINWWNWWN